MTVTFNYQSHREKLNTYLTVKAHIHRSDTKNKHSMQLNKNSEDNSGAIYLLLGTLCVFQQMICQHEPVC